MVLPFNIALYSGMSGAMSGASGYDTDAQAYFDAIVTAGGSISDTNKGYVDDFVTGLKADGLWTGAIFIYLYAAQDTHGALINLRSPAVSGSAVNSPTWTQYQGYTGDGVSAYVTSGYQGDDIDPDSAVMGLFVRTQDSSRRPIMGYRAARGYIQHGGSIAFNAGLVSGSASTTSSISSSNEIVSVRRNGTTQDIRQGTSTEGSVTVSTNTLNITNNLVVLHDGSGTIYSGGQVAASFLTSYMDDTAINNFRTRLRTYLLAIGAIT